MDRALPLPNRRGCWGSIWLVAVEYCREVAESATLSSAEAAAADAEPEGEMDSEVPSDEAAVPPPPC